MLQVCWWSVCQSMSVYVLIASVTSRKTTLRTADCYLFPTNLPFRLAPAYTERWSEPSWYSLGRIESLFENETASAKQIFRQTIPCAGHINECWAQLITYHIHTNDYGKMAAFSSTKAVKCGSFSVLRSFYFPCSQTESWDKIFPLFFVSFPIVVCILIVQYVIIFKYQSIEVFCLFYLLLFSWNRVLLCNPGWPLCSKPPSSVSQHIIGYNYVCSIVLRFKPTQFWSKQNITFEPKDVRMKNVWRQAS